MEPGHQGNEVQADEDHLVESEEMASDE